MTNQMDYGAFQWALHDLVDSLRPRLPDGIATGIGEYIDHNELGLAISDLIDVLLLERIALTPGEHGKVRDLLTWFREAGARLAVVVEMDGILDVLDRTDRPGHGRGLPPLRGGHLPHSGRPGATEFPSDWDTAQVHAAAECVGAEPSLLLPNTKTWREGEVRGVRIGILDDADGARRTIVPLPGPGVARTPLTTTPVPQRLASGVEASGAALLGGLRPLVSETESRCLKALLDTGEWDELADAVAARLMHIHGRSLGNIAARAREMLLAFDLPVEGCAFLNDRDAVLARLEAT